MPLNPNPDMLEEGGNNSHSADAPPASFVTSRLQRPNDTNTTNPYATFNVFCATLRIRDHAQMIGVLRFVDIHFLFFRKSRNVTFQFFIIHLFGVLFVVFFRLHVRILHYFWFARLLLLAEVVVPCDGEDLHTFLFDFRGDIIPFYQKLYHFFKSIQLGFYFAVLLWISFPLFFGIPLEIECQKTNSLEGVRSDSILNSQNYKTNCSSIDEDELRCKFFLQSFIDVDFIFLSGIDSEAVLYDSKSK